MRIFYLKTSNDSLGQDRPWISSSGKGWPNEILRLIDCEENYMILKTKLATAVAMTITGTALSMAGVSTASAASTTMYNLYNENGGVACAPCSTGATDGWVYGGIGGAPSAGVTGWAGTSSPTTAAFGYTGGGVLHWGLHMDNFGSAEISNADSLSTYGKSADIDVAKGAWSDAVSGNTNPGAKGWRHDLDFGLFKSDVAGKVTLDVQGVNQSGTNFGFTVFKGMDTSTGAYGHHGSWNANNNEGGVSADSLPGGGTNFTVSDIVAYSVGGTSPMYLNTISFDAEAGEIYTIALGGYRNGAWGDTTDGYVLNASVSAVPVPAAVWLMGSGLVGLLGLQRRKQAVSA